MQENLVLEGQPPVQSFRDSRGLRGQITVLVLRGNPFRGSIGLEAILPAAPTLVYRQTQLKTLPSRNVNVKRHVKQISLVNRHDADVFIIAENVPQVVRDMGEVGTNQSVFCHAQTIANNTTLTMLTYICDVNTSVNFLFPSRSDY